MAYKNATQKILGSKKSSGLGQDWASIGDQLGVQQPEPQANFLQRLLAPIMGLGSIPDAIYQSTYNGRDLLGTYLGNIGQGIGTAFTGNLPKNELKTTQDLLKRGNIFAGNDTGSNIARGALGFAGDVVLDPLTYLLPGVGGLGEKAAKGAVEKLAPDVAAKLAESGIKEEVVKTLAEKGVKGIGSIFDKAGTVFTDAEKMAGINDIARVTKGLVNEKTLRLGLPFTGLESRSLIKNQPAVKAISTLINPIGAAAGVAWKGVKKVAPELAQGAETSVSKLFSKRREWDIAGKGPIYDAYQQFANTIKASPNAVGLEFAPELNALQDVLKTKPDEFYKIPTYIERPDLVPQALQPIVDKIRTAIGGTQKQLKIRNIIEKVNPDYMKHVVGGYTEQFIKNDFKDLAPFILNDARAIKDMARPGANYIEKSTLAQIVGDKALSQGSTGIKSIEKMMDDSLLQRRFKTLEDGMMKGVVYDNNPINIFTKQMVDARNSMFTYDFATNVLPQIKDTYGAKAFLNGVDLEAMYKGQVPPTWGTVDFGLDGQLKKTNALQLDTVKGLEQQSQKEMAKASQYQSVLDQKIAQIQGKGMGVIGVNPVRGFEDALQKQVDLFKSQGLSIGDIERELGNSGPNGRINAMMNFLTNPNKQEELRKFGFKPTIVEKSAIAQEILSKADPQTIAPIRDVIQNIADQGGTGGLGDFTQTAVGLQDKLYGYEKKLQALGVKKDANLELLRKSNDAIQGFQSNIQNIKSGLDTLNKQTTYYAPKESIALIKGYTDTMMKQNAPNGVLQTFDKLNQFFKRIVTGGGPGAYAYNVKNTIGDTINLLTGGMTPGAIIKGSQIGWLTGDLENAAKKIGWQKAIIDPKLNPVMRTLADGTELRLSDLYTQAMNNGLTGIGTQISEEVGKQLDQKALGGIAAKLGQADTGLGNVVKKITLQPIARQRENAMRIASLLDAFDHTDTTASMAQRFADAIPVAKLRSLDFNNLTQFEQNVVKRIVPFYSFFKQNLKLQMTQFVNNPKVLATEMKVFNNIKQSFGGDISAEDWAALPEWMRTGLSFVTSKNAAGDVNVLTSFGDPLTQLNNVIGGGSGLPIGTTINKLISSSSPYLKMPLELALGQNTFTGQSISSEQGRNGYSYKDMPQFVKDAIGYKEISGEDKNGKKYVNYTVDPEKAYIFSNLPGVSSGLLFGKRISNLTAKDNKLEDTINALLPIISGIRSYGRNITSEKATRQRELDKRIQDELYKQGLGKTFSTFYLTQPAKDKLAGLGN